MCAVHSLRLFMQHYQQNILPSLWLSTSRRNVNIGAGPGELECWQLFMTDGRESLLLLFAASFKLISGLGLAYFLFLIFENLPVNEANT